MEKLNVFYGYGTLVKFVEYRDIWVCKSIINKDDKICVTKLPYFAGLDHIVTYQDNNNPIIDVRVDAILVNDLSKIEITELWDAIYNGQLFYNHFIEFNERAITLYAKEDDSQIKYAIETAEKMNCVVMLFYCSMNDDRYYVPVVSSDKLWDVRVRLRLYRRAMRFINAELESEVGK